MSQLITRSRDDQIIAPLVVRPYSTLPSTNAKASLSQPQRPDKQTRLEIPRSSSVYPDDISPPDSPRTIDATRSRKSSPNISPITDRGSTHNSAFVSSRPYVSGIPLPKVHGQISGAGSVSGWREKVGRATTPTGSPTTTKWDDFSGEPTSSNTGKPAQATPGTAQFDKQEADRLANGEAKNTTKFGGDLGKIPFSTKLRKVSGNDTSEQPREREEWKGASGRHTIVKSVADTPRTSGKGPTAAHFKGSLKHTIGLRPRPTPGKTSPSRASPTASRSVTTPGSVEAKQQPQTQLNSVNESHEQDSNHIDPPILPVVPLKVRRSTPNTPSTQPRTEVITSDHDTTMPPTRKSSLETRTSHNVEPRSPPESPPQGKPPEILESEIAAVAQNFSISNEPGSRFSVTTYNTTIPESPPATPRRSLDNPPPLPTPPSSILNRKRPIPVAGVMLGTKAKPPTRKPTPSQVESDTSKSLPLSPPTAAAVDRVSLLQANLDSLNRRRQNLQTVIHELTHVVQPSSIAYDMASRQEIKKTVEGLHTESAAVAKEIHETGMKLHRAMKRRDEDSMFEPTGLWVRRVTTE